MKFEDEILNEIQEIIQQQNGVISQAQIIQILQKYYSSLYAEGQGFKKIEREITRRNIAKNVKVNIPNFPSQKYSKNSQLNQLFSLYLSPTVPDDQKRTLISTFIRSSMPVIGMPTMKRTISKELFIEHSAKISKRTETMEFPSIQFRSMLLHQFLLSTFGTTPYSIEMISNSIPVHLSSQIIRGFEIDPIVMPLIQPLNKSLQFEFSMLIPYLRPPYHSLIKKIDSTYNVNIPNAVVEIPSLGICKRFDFFNDPSAVSDYWLLIFSLGKEKITQYPLSISTRFEKFILIHFDKFSINEVPFFPFQIEKFSQKFGLPASLASYSIQKVFKKKMKQLQCSKETLLESKLFPVSGLMPFLITKSSFFKSPDPKYPRSLSTPFRVDGSLNCLAKLFAASQLTEEGYIINQRSNFKLFKKQVKRWVSQCSTFFNFFTSFKENSVFSSLIKYEMALLIEEMKFPSLFFNRIDFQPLKTITIETHPESESDKGSNEEVVDENENENENENFHIMEKSNSANFHIESMKQVSRILKSPSFIQNDKVVSKNNLSGLNDIFAKSFPDFTKEQMFSHEAIQQKQETDQFDGYFEEKDEKFPTSYLIDSPVNSDPSNDEVIEQPIINESSQDDDNRNSFNESNNDNDFLSENQNEINDSDQNNNNDDFPKDNENDSNNNNNKSDISDEDNFSNEKDDDFDGSENDSQNISYDGDADDEATHHHFISDFEEDSDEIIQYPILDPSDFREGTQSEFLSLFEVKKRLIDVDVPVSVAIEFIKIIFSSPSDKLTNDIKLRQSIHFSQSSANDAIWLLSAIGIFLHSELIKIPESQWELSIPEKSYPQPIFIPFCESQDFDDLAPIKIEWNKIPSSGENAANYEEDEDEDEDLIDDIDEDIFADDSKKDANKKKYNFITFQFKNVTIKQQINAYKKEKISFAFQKQRMKFPHLPKFEATKTSSPDLYLSSNQLYSYDPLGQYSFGQYDVEVPFIEDFVCRFIFNIVNSSGVYGIDLTDIIHSFGFTVLNSDNVIAKVEHLCSLELICRVPSSRLVPRYSRFIPCNTICKPVSNKVNLVQPHIWTNFDGFINIEVKVSLIKNITSFVFANEFCDFWILAEEFSYVSPYDLCILLELLECDEIIFSQYFLKSKSDLFDDEVNIPIPSFKSFEKFLIVLDFQKKNNGIDPTYHRILRTNRSMLPNLCNLYNI